MRVQLYVKAVASIKKRRGERRVNLNQRRDRKREIEKVYLLSPDYILRCRERKRERERIKHVSCNAARRHFYEKCARGFHRKKLYKFANFTHIFHKQGLLRILDKVNIFKHLVLVDKSRSI